MNPQLTQIDQLFYSIQRFNPQLTLNTEIQSNQLYAILNDMSKQAHGIEYDLDTFQELYQRAEQAYQFVTIKGFLDVHLQAVEILNLRVENQKFDYAQIKNFTNQLVTKQSELGGPQNRMNENSQLIIKNFTVFGNDAYQVQPYLLRLVSEDQRYEQQFPLQNFNGKFVCEPQSRIGLNNLYQSFQVEIIDQTQNIVAYATLQTYYMGILNNKSVQLFVQFADGYPRDLSIAVEGYVDVTNLEYARQDYQVLKDEEVRISQDLGSTQDQLRSLSYPFESTLRAPSHQPSFHNQGYNAGMSNFPTNQQNPQFEEGFAGARTLSTNKNILVQGGVKDGHMHTSTNDDCDFDSKSLVKNIHYLLIIYLVCAIIFCAKRSMFLDVTIGISFLAVLYRVHSFQQHKIVDILKVFIGLFATTAALDLAWLIVYFPSWNRDVSSEDEGAQGVLRIIILGGSLLFMIYKVLLIVAVFFLNKDFARQADVVNITIQNFLTGNDFSRTSHSQSAVAASKTYH